MAINHLRLWGTLVASFILVLDCIQPISARIGGLPAGQHNEVRSSASSGANQYLTKATEKYYVDPNKVPDVTFDSGESYAGRMPLNDTSDQNMYFWFYPTVNPAGKDDIIIWFNGGPGCSSLEGRMQENGPWTWQYGTYRPVPNVWSWHKLANIIWFVKRNPTRTHQELDRINQKCGHDEYVQKYLTYPPPKRPFPKLDLDKEPGCDILTPFFEETNLVNPCFNQYHISDTCPILWDVLGYPNMPYVPEGAEIWFNIKEVRKALHIPLDAPDWASCQSPVYAGDGSDNYDSEEHADRLRRLIETTNNVIIGSGMLDMVIAPNVTALAIQMMDWNKKQGFQSRPDSDFTVPAGPDLGIAHLAGAGHHGFWHKERGLTWVTANLAGHMVPQYAPTAAFRQLEVLLGRVKSLKSSEPYSVNISTSFTWPY